MTDAEEVLQKIAEAIEQSKGDPKKEAILLDALIDPQDALNCEGCQ